MKNVGIEDDAAGHVKSRRRKEDFIVLYPHQREEG